VVGKTGGPAALRMCTSCGNCSAYCEMGIDVRQYAMANQFFKRAACVGCGMCAHRLLAGCPEARDKPDRHKAGTPVRVLAKGSWPSTSAQPGLRAIRERFAGDPWRMKPSFTSACGSPNGSEGGVIRAGLSPRVPPKDLAPWRLPVLN
jgi:ferredoxin